VEDQNALDELTDTPDDQQSNGSNMPKRRSIIAIAIGCLLIWTCLYIFAAFLAILWDEAEFFYGVLGFCPGVILFWFAFRQYRALFSCDSERSHSFSGCFFVVAFFAFLIALVMGFGASRENQFGNVSQDFVVFLTVAVVLLLIGVASTWNNRRRGVVIPNPEPFGTPPPFTKRYWKRDMIGLLILSSITAGIVCYKISTIPPVYAENIPYEQMVHQSFFPKEGQDYCYIRTGRGTISCEFTIDEQRFRDWIAAKDYWEYCRPIEANDDIWILPRSAYRKGDTRWNENEEQPRPVVSDGLYAGYGEHKGGRAVFDRVTQRVYYWTFY